MHKERDGTMSSRSDGRHGREMKEKKSPARSLDAIPATCMKNDAIEERHFCLPPLSAIVDILGLR